MLLVNICVNRLVFEFMTNQRGPNRAQQGIKPLMGRDLVFDFWPNKPRLIYKKWVAYWPIWIQFDLFEAYMT